MEENQITNLTLIVAITLAVLVGLCCVASVLLVLGGMFLSGAGG